MALAPASDLGFPTLGISLMVVPFVAIPGAVFGAALGTIVKMERTHLTISFDQQGRVQNAHLEAPLLHGKLAKFMNGVREHVFVRSRVSLLRYLLDQSPSSTSNRDLEAGTRLNG